MMFDTGVGVRNPLFFIGVVENNIDQRLEGRVQVRAFGIHGTNRDIPTEDLPWATVVSGAYDPNNPVPALNSWVFGVFLDGRDAQRPMLLGLIPTQYAEPFDPETTGWGVIPDRYMHQLARGSRPRDFGQPQSARIVRAENIDESYVAAQAMGRVEDIEMAIREEGEERRTWSEPGPAYDATYPFNRVIESMSGDSHIQIDDTPGAERITIWHRSGSYIEIDAGGTTTHKATSDKYEVNDKNLHVYVGGRASLTVEGDYHVRVKGHKIEEIEGDYTQIVRGNHMIAVAGQANINASEAVQMRAAQITIESNVSNMSLLSRKTISLTAFGFKVEPGGSAEGISLKAMAGKINIHAPARDVNISAGMNLRLAGIGQTSIFSGSTVAIDAPLISLANGVVNLGSSAFARALNSPVAIQTELPEPPAKSVGVNDYRNGASVGTSGIGGEGDESGIEAGTRDIPRNPLGTQGEIANFAERNGINQNALLGVLTIESGLNPNAQGGASNRFYGVFQLEDRQIPSLTQRAFGRSLTPQEYRNLSVGEQLQVYQQYINQWVPNPRSFFTGNAAQDASRLWALQLAPANAMRIDYTNPNATISATRQAQSISARPGLVTVSSVQRATLERGGFTAWTTF